MSTPDPAIAGDTKGTKGMLIATILISVTLAAIAQILLKNGMDRVTAASGAFSPASATSLKAAATTPLVWLGLFTFGLSALVWLAVLSRAELSFAYPFASLTYVIILVYSKFVANEPVSATRWAGVALIVGGILLVARGAP